MFGVRAATIAGWARAGKIPFVLTPGGHRRYRRSAMRAVVNGDRLAEDDPALLVEAADAVRLYDQGWSINQVAKQFNTSYGAMRRLLKRNGVTFRGNGTNRMNL